MVEPIFDISNPHAMAYLESHALELVTTIEESLKVIVTEQITEGMKLGESAYKISRRISGKLKGDYPKWMAKRVARTEALKASNEGALEAYRQSGVVRGKRWLASPDACEEWCVPLDGVEATLNESFPGGFDSPPAHPNCRCAVSPVL